MHLASYLCGVKVEILHDNLRKGQIVLIGLRAKQLDKLNDLVRPLCNQTEVCPERVLVVLEQLLEAGVKVPAERLQPRNHNGAQQLLGRSAVVRRGQTSVGRPLRVLDLALLAAEEGRVVAVLQNVRDELYLAVDRTAGVEIVNQVEYLRVQGGAWYAHGAGLEVGRFFAFAMWLEAICVETSAHAVGCFENGHLVAFALQE